jgi:hypothetical protein
MTHSAEPAATEPAGQPDTDRTARPGMSSAMRGLAPGLLLDVVLPLATYYVLTGLGTGTVAALLLSGLWPLASIALTVARTRRLDGFGLFILVSIGIGALTSALFDDARFVLLKDSAITGGIGVFFLVSLVVMPRPIMFYFGRRFGTDGSPAGLSRWDGYWANPVFRRGQRTMTVIWGLGFLAEAVVRIALGLTLPLDVMVGISAVLPFVVLAGLITWTITYAKRNATAARAAAADAGDDTKPIRD